MKNWAKTGLAVGTAFCLAASVFAAEHPKEHPSEGDEAGKMSMDELGTYIENFIWKDGKLKGGLFTVYDPVGKKPLALQLVRVHKEKLCMLRSKVCFACADFKAGDGTLYDLDFFIKHEGDKMEVTEISIHKENGKERYGWTSKDGIWEKVPMGAAK